MLHFPSHFHSIFRVFPGAGPILPEVLGYRSTLSGVSNLQPTDCMEPREAMNAAQHTITNILKIKTLLTSFKNPTDWFLSMNFVDDIVVVTVSRLNTVLLLTGYRA